MSSRPPYWTMCFTHYPPSVCHSLLHCPFTYFIFFSPFPKVFSSLLLFYHSPYVTYYPPRKPFSSVLLSPPIFLQTRHSVSVLILFIFLLFVFFPFPRGKCLVSAFNKFRVSNKRLRYQKYAGHTIEVTDRFSKKNTH